MAGSSSTCLRDEFLARQIAVGVGDHVAVGGRHVRIEHEIDEGVGGVRVRRILRDGEIVEPHLRSLARDRIADLDAVLGGARAVFRLLDVARPADHQADFAARQRVEIFRGMEFSHIGTDLAEQRRRAIEIVRLGGVRIEMQIMQRRRHYVVGGIEHVDAAVLELGDDLRLEHHVPAIDLGIGAQARVHRLDVVADAGGAPHVVDAVSVAGVVGGKPPGDLRPLVHDIGQLALVELLEHAGLDLALQEIGGRHHHVVARLAGEQLGLQRLVGVEGVVDHLDAGARGEQLEHGRVDIVRPVVDIDHAVLRRGGRRGNGADGRSECGDEQDTAHGEASGVHGLLVGSPAAFQAMMPPARCELYGKPRSWATSAAVTERWPERQAKTTCLPLRVGNGGGVEARQRHDHRVGIAFDVGLFRLAHVDQQHAALAQALGDLLRGQVFDLAGAQVPPEHRVMLLRSAPF